jgi:two-component sensor histidine kinase
MDAQKTTEERSQEAPNSLPVVADISRSDLLLLRYLDRGHAVIVSQAQPHSIMPLYPESFVGREISITEFPMAFAPLIRGIESSGAHPATINGAPVMREVLAWRDSAGQAIGALGVATTLFAWERHRRRSRVFQGAVRRLQVTALRGELIGAEALSPFGEHDGLVFVDAQRRIQYVSGIATNFYQRLGYMERLVGRRVGSLATADEELVERALSTGSCLEHESEEQGLLWVRKVLPVRGRSDWALGLTRLGLRGKLSTDSHLVGALVAIHDDTEGRRQARELKVQLALVQEVHHRVKNNLQTIASLLRLQSRRVTSTETKTVLHESINRILSIAVVHEFLSQGGSSAINVKDIAKRIISQMQEMLLAPDKRIRFDLDGPNIYLPSRQATACALIINELLQNAVEHGFEKRSEGVVGLTLTDEGEKVHIQVRDDGDGLPPGFDLASTTSLGLRIVQALVRDDLKGQFALSSLAESGAEASVVFAKQLSEGGRI